MALVGLFARQRSQTLRAIRVALHVRDRWSFALAPLILTLLLSGRPLTIRFIVALIRIDAIERVLWRWSAAHVGQERWIRFQPMPANTDAPPAIVFEIFITCVATSCFHVGPTKILSRLLCFTVNFVC
jgi:hypothetical protein